MQDLLILGKGSTQGGSFKTVKVAGQGKIFGHVKADEIEVLGNATIDGNIQAEQVHVSGLARLNGDLQSAQICNAGNLTVEGDAKAAEIKNRGKLSFYRTLNTDRLSSFGYLNVRNGIDAKDFECYGSFETHGYVCANTVRIKIDGWCEADEIYAKQIDVRLGSGGRFADWIKSFVLPFVTKNWRMNQHLICNRLEGERIYLENSDVKAVKGDWVIIGPNCRIHQLEYKEQVEIDPSSIVEEKIKVE